MPGLGRTAFSFTNTSIVRYRGNNFDLNTHDDRFLSLTERLDFTAQAAPWRLYARLDGFSPLLHDTSCSSEVDSLCYLRSNYRPERVQLRYQRGEITLEGGDFYQVFGRGVSLAFRKVDPIGLDTTLRGGRFEYERDRLTVRGFGGLANPQNLDPISLGIFADPTDVLVGGSASARVGADADIELSGHALHVEFERLGDARRQDTVDVAGWRVEFPSLLDGDLSLYGEANVLRRQIRIGDASLDRGTPTVIRPGRGVYVSAQLQRGRWTFLTEWKDYTHYVVAPTESANSSPRDVARVYSTAPSLERDDQRIFTNANTRGARLRIDYSPRPSPWIFTVNSVLYGWAESSNFDGSPIDPWDAHEGYLTTHSYFAVRRRSRPVISPQRSPADAASPAANPGAAASSSAAAGGANITAGGLGGGSVTRVSRGDFNLIASVGYRREFHAGTQQVEAGSDPTHRAGEIKHESLQADFDIAFPVGRNDSLELRIDHRFERNFTFDPLRGSIFTPCLWTSAAPGETRTDNCVLGSRGGISLSWSHGLPLVVSAMVRWDNTSRGATDNNLFDSPFGRSGGMQPRLPTLYPAAELRWNFTISNFVRLFAGMTPGGRVCSGGVCRDVPLFQGAIAEVVLRI